MILRLLPLVVAFVLLRGVHPHEAQQDAKTVYVCPPCGVECHDLTYEKPGSCSVCGMKLVASADVPKVAVLLFEGADLLTSTGPLAVFVASRAATVYTVADTTDPIRCNDALTLVPRFELAGAPAPDVLIVPAGDADVLDDALVMDWVRDVSDAADFVLGTGTGALVVAKTGRLDGEAIAANEYVAQRAATVAPGVRCTTDEVVECGKFFTARDARSALAASFRIVALLAGEEKAELASKRLGFSGSERESAR